MLTRCGLDKIRGPSLLLKVLQLPGAYPVVPVHILVLLYPSHAQVVLQTQHQQIFEPYPSITGNSQGPILLLNNSTLRPASLYRHSGTPRQFASWVPLLSSRRPYITGANCCKSKLLLTTTFARWSCSFPVFCLFLSIFYSLVVALCSISYIALPPVHQTIHLLCSRGSKQPSRIRRCGSNKVKQIDFAECQA